ncbi:DUF1214 domain-containing protein [Bradyrhizobium sp. JYMT SZCCT0428]|nr:DUF1214 domain-containing protein [Bradyrhizobium sp. JYMT SZCCT0428]
MLEVAIRESLRESNRHRVWKEDAFKVSRAADQIFGTQTDDDNQTRSMLQTPQRYPRAGSQTYPSPAAVAEVDGSTTIFFGPTKHAAAKDGNWIQTTPGKGWFTLLRLYSPRESFFTKAWRPTEITLVR